MNRVLVLGASVVWLATALLRAQSPPRRHHRRYSRRVHRLWPPGGGSPIGRIDYTSQIKPILDEFCEDCHDGETRKGGLSLATYDDVLEGGRSGAALRPGQSAASLIVERLTGVVEPTMPKDEDVARPDRSPSSVPGSTRARAPPRRRRRPHNPGTPPSR